MEKHLLNLKTQLLKAMVQGSRRGSEIAIMFSGGLDSSLLAYLADNHAEYPDITLYTVGTRMSHDIISAEKAAKILSLRLMPLEITIQDILSSIPDLAKLIDTDHPVKISYELPLYWGLSHIREDFIMYGQGADELFGGYARYLKMENNDLEIALKKDTDTLLSQGLVMEQNIARHFGKDLHAPYLDEDVVNAALQIPLEFKVREGERKIILKSLAAELGLPSELVNREKKAAQYGSGIIKELRKAAKTRKMGVNDLIGHIIGTI
jgi:asparagine synthase (glutamine-hydrolysing)